MYRRTPRIPGVKCSILTLISSFALSVAAGKSALPTSIERGGYSVGAAGVKANSATSNSRETDQIAGP
jgi:hypothetical protein